MKEEEKKSLYALYKELNSKDKASVKMLLYILLLEVVITCLLYNSPAYDVVWALSVVDIVLLTLTALLLTCVFELFSDAKKTSNHFGFNSFILTRLLGNTIAPRKLGVLYLFAFVIHLGWITNSSFDIISYTGTSFRLSLFVPLITSVAGLLCLVYFFPNPITGKDENATKVYVSGMSVIQNSTWSNLISKLGNKDFTKEKIEFVEEKFNIIPLVRILKLHKDNERGWIEILRSEDLSYQVMKYPDDWEGHKDIHEPDSENARLYTLWKEIMKMDTFLRPFEAEKERNERLALYESYGINDAAAGTDDDEFQKFITVLIKIFAKFEFPDKVNAIMTLNVRFTDKCDYNNYSSCFNTMNDVVSNLDDEQHELIFNLTPGTALISSVMTLLAIDGDRKLYFHEQFSKKNVKKIDDLVHEVDKLSLPIENLLSQALEKITNG